MGWTPGGPQTIIFKLAMVELGDLKNDSQESLTVIVGNGRGLWALSDQVSKGRFCRTSQLRLQFSIGMLHIIGLSTKAVLVARRA